MAVPPKLPLPFSQLQDTKVPFLFLFCLLACVVLSAAGRVQRGPNKRRLA